jgi:hypothetical protein
MRPRRSHRTMARLFPVILAFNPIHAVGAGAQQPTVVVPPPSDTLYAVELVDGSVLYARISDTSVVGRVVLITSGGARLEMESSQIRAIRPATGRVVRGEYWPEDASATRLFFTATGRALERGQAYVGTYLIILPFVAVGVTDRLTLAAGAPVLTGELEPFYIAPKLQLVRTPRAELSVGTLAFFFRDENVGIAYGVGTFGTPDDALTIGLGFGYSGADFSSQPVAMVGAETRVSRRVKLLTENYFLPGETGVVFSGGIRFVGDRLSTDVGMAGAAADGDAGCCVPLINFSYAFGRGR